MTTQHDRLAGERLAGERLAGERLAGNTAQPTQQPTQPKAPRASTPQAPTLTPNEAFLQGYRRGILDGLEAADERCADDDCHGTDE